MKASNLDIDRFRKVHALIAGGATDGERQAAEARATEMARKAGMTLQQAVSKMDGTQKPKPGNFFDGFEDWMEEKEPGYKAQRSREEAERQARYAKRRAEILKEFGTVKAFLDPTPLEQLLIMAGDPFVTKRGSFEDVCGTERHFASEFAGVNDQPFSLQEIHPEAIAAIKAAFPFPSGVCEAFEELRMWDQLERDRANFYDHHEYYFDLPVGLRIELLRDVMGSQPVSSWDDLDARFRYKSYSWQRQWIDERTFEDAEWSRLFADVQILRAMVETAQGRDETGAVVRSAAECVNTSSVQTGRRTNADKAGAVVSILDSHPELSDREISRRVGVSPQTVSNWRRRLAAKGAHNLDTLLGRAAA